MSSSIDLTKAAIKSNTSFNGRTVYKLIVPIDDIHSYVVSISFGSSSIKVDIALTQDQNFVRTPENGFSTTGGFVPASGIQNIELLRFRIKSNGRVILGKTHSFSYNNFSKRLGDNLLVHIAKKLSPISSWLKDTFLCCLEDHLSKTEMSVENKKAMQEMMDGVLNLATEALTDTRKVFGEVVSGNKIRRSLHRGLALSSMGSEAVYGAEYHLLRFFGKLIK